MMRIIRSSHWFRKCVGGICVQSTDFVKRQQISNLYQIVICKYMATLPQRKCITNLFEGRRRNIYL